MPLPDGCILKRVGLREQWAAWEEEFTNMLRQCPGLDMAMPRLVEVLYTFPADGADPMHLAGLARLQRWGSRHVCA